MFPMSNRCKNIKMSEITQVAHYDHNAILIDEDVASCIVNVRSINEDNSDAISH